MQQSHKYWSIYNIIERNKQAVIHLVCTELLHSNQIFKLQLISTNKRGEPFQCRLEVNILPFAGLHRSDRVVAIGAMKIRCKSVVKTFTFDCDKLVVF